MTKCKNEIIIISGPTASGKSALALTIARQLNGVIINADAMQLYRELKILTARPGEEELALVPHKLYGILPSTQPASAGIWLNLAVAAINQCWQEGRTPILVGGTGLYIKALLEGLSVIPDIPEEIRLNIRQKSGEEHLYQELKGKDPEMAARLKPGDTQRISRALEVIEATGQSLARWQEEPRQPPFPNVNFQVFRMDIPRQELYDRCNTRFDAMLAEGALDEVKSLRDLKLDRSLPALRSLGVPELMAYLDDLWTWDQAVEKAKQSTRNYAKRQLTWLNHQLKEAKLISPNHFPVDRNLGKP